MGASLLALAKSIYYNYIILSYHMSHFTSSLRSLVKYFFNTRREILYLQVAM